MTAAAELAAMLALEAEAGVMAALAGPDRRLRLTQVVTRVGRPATDSDDPWEVELRLLPGTSPIGVVVDPSGAGAEPAIPHVIAALPVGAVQGAGAVWAARFANVGITTVIELADISPTDLRRITLAARSRRGVILAGRASQCRLELPPRPTSPHVSSAPTTTRFAPAPTSTTVAAATPRGPSPRTVGRLVGTPPADVAAELGVTLTAAAMIAATVTRLATSIDMDVLDTIPLQQLWET